jgi:hypothetical protein
MKSRIIVFLVFMALGLGSMAWTQSGVGGGGQSNVGGSGGGINTPFIQSSGTAAVITGTGACATVSTQSGGAWSGRITCTGATAASTFVITPGFTANNGWICSVYDETTRANAIQQTSTTTTACTSTATSVTTGDVVVFTAFAF